MGGELILRPKSTEVIQTPDITTSSYRCARAREGESSLVGSAASSMKHKRGNEPTQSRRRRKAPVLEQRGRPLGVN